MVWLYKNLSHGCIFDEENLNISQRFLSDRYNANTDHVKASKVYKTENYELVQYQKSCGNASHIFLWGRLHTIFLFRLIRPWSLWYGGLNGTRCWKCPISIIQEAKYSHPHKRTPCSTVLVRYNCSKVCIHFINDYALCMPINQGKCIYIVYQCMYTMMCFWTCCSK